MEGGSVGAFIDIYSVSLLAVTLTVYVMRYLRDEPPVLPYLIIECVCAVGHELGRNGSGMGVVMLLISATFLIMSCVFYPHIRHFSGRKPGRRYN